MRFSSLLALMAPIAMLSSASAAGLPANIPMTTLTKRAVTVPICANVAVNLRVLDLLDVNLGQLCLCATADGLTSGSLLQLRTATNNRYNAGLLGFLGTTLDAVVGSLQTATFGLLGSTTQADNTCPAGTVSGPNTQFAANGDTCATCSIICSPGFVACNGGCIATTEVCPTVGMGRKRSVKERSRYACPQPLTACPVSHFLARETAATYGGGFECIDTTSNLESCGGCATPFKGSAAGEDCTAIANVDSVSCTSGQCIVDSCAPGFVPTADFSACEKASRFSSSRLTVQGRSRRK